MTLRDLLKTCLRIWLPVWLPGVIMASAPDSVTVRVMTFNIRYHQPADGIYAWPERKELVFSLLGKQDPDIIGFQEALHDQVVDIIKALPGYGWYGVGRDDGAQEGEYAPIFFNSARFSSDTSGHFWLSETPGIAGSISWGAACTRIVTWVKLTDKLTGEKLLVFNTHFDHISEQAREASALLLSDSIRKLAGEIPVIVTGDFNAPPVETAYRVMTSLLSDTRDGFFLPDSACTYIGFPAVCHPGVLIDYIFFTPGSGTVLDYMILTFNRDGFYPSDHYPVESIIRYPVIQSRK